MSKFISGMDASNSSMLIGENGTLEYSVAAVGDSRVALSFALVRNIPKPRLNELFQTVITDSATQESKISAEVIADLFVLVFQTRDCRGGKGEKALFFEMLLQLFKHYPQTVLKLVHLIPKYGCYKDIFKLLSMISTDNDFTLLKDRLIMIVSQRLLHDDKVLREWDMKSSEEKSKSRPGLSLCAKFAPREGKQLYMESYMESLQQAMFPEVAKDKTMARKILYRKLVVRLNKVLDVTEIKMGSKRYREIDFSHVPSVCLNKFRKAFLNEKIAHKSSGIMDSEETGDRYPLDEDRVECRKHLRETMVSLTTGIHGKQVQPHILVQQCLKGSHSTAEIDLFNAQWIKIREDVVKSLETKEVVEGAIDFRKLVPLVDVSSSMNGDPMHAAIGLGILTSEVNHPLFRDRFITFETTPTWCNLSACTTFERKVKAASKASWGGSTDIDKAFDLIIDVVWQNKLPMSEVPDLIIFSDMQFDMAAGSDSTTQLQRIQKKFAEVGKKISGTPYPAPRIVFWNLRGDTSGYPAKANHPNIQMLSGFSPSLLKLALSGEPIVVSDNKTDKVPEVNPYDTFRKMVDDERYDAIRIILDKSTELALAHYNFTPSEKILTKTSSTDVDQENEVPSKQARPLIVEDDWDMLLDL